MNRQIANIYAAKKGNYHQRQNKSKFDRNSSNVKAYLNNNISKDRNGNNVPSAIQNHYRSFHPSPNRHQGEENKRANSVASGETIISTASSSSPLKRNHLYLKNNLQQVGLMISGGQVQTSGNSRRGDAALSQNGGNRHGAQGSRVSPYMKPLGSAQHSGGYKHSKPTGNTANTDSELYGNKSSSLH